MLQKAATWPSTTYQTPKQPKISSRILNPSTRSRLCLSKAYGYLPHSDFLLCHATEPRQQDAQDRASNENVVKEAATQLGSLDIVIANAGWTRFGEFSDLSALSEDEWDKCWAVNVRAPLTLMKAAKPHFDKNDQGGVFLITSSVAAQTIGGSSMAYSVTKAAQVHLTKCMANTQGQKIRCNAVLPGLLLTEWVRPSFSSCVRELEVSAAS